jgi:hypothetical protein
MESMRDYAVRRALEVKQYRKCARESGIGEEAFEWLSKFARNEIPNSGVSRVEKLYRYYKMLESQGRRRR